MGPTAAIDTLLDRSIVLGYGTVGLAVRKRLPGWPSDPPRMHGKVVLITGAASGIGLAAAQGFAALGATVLPVARTDARAAEAHKAILDAVPGAAVRPLACDVSSLAELRRFTDTLRREQDRLDVIVNNAGVMPDERSYSAEGHELMFATHVLAPFALTAWLEDMLRVSAPARVINVSSGGMYGRSLPHADVEADDESYGPAKLYARTKREQVVITELWAERLRGTGVVVHAMHPGWVDTPGISDALPGFRAAMRQVLRDGAQGADTIVWLGAAPGAAETTGRFWHDRRPRPTHYWLGGRDGSETDRLALWTYCQSALER